MMMMMLLLTLLLLLLLQHDKLPVQQRLLHPIRPNVRDAGLSAVRHRCRVPWRRSTGVRGTRVLPHGVAAIGRRAVHPADRMCRRRQQHVRRRLHWRPVSAVRCRLRSCVGVLQALPVPVDAGVVHVLRAHRARDRGCGPVRYPGLRNNVAICAHASHARAVLHCPVRLQMDGSTGAHVHGVRAVVIGAAVQVDRHRVVPVLAAVRHAVDAVPRHQ